MTMDVCAGKMRLRVRRCSADSRFHCHIPLLLVLLLWVDAITCANWKAVMAPSIVQQPKTEMAYKRGEDVTLPCIADPDSNAVYEWKKDGYLLNFTGRNDVTMLSGVGSLFIRAISKNKDGVYQCFARNQFGTALSSKATLKEAVLNPFPGGVEPVLQTPVVGRPLTLFCSSPKCYPKGNSYWGVNRPLSNKLEAIENNDRIVLDYDGNLHFTNVVPSDSLGGAMYVCIVNNALLGAYVQGNDQRVSPTLIEESPKYYEPSLLWSSPSTDVAVKGQTKRIKCIFSGLPTPKVTWRRLEQGQSFGRRTRVTPAGHGTELEITDVVQEDAGQYECRASNSESGKSASKVITLIVQSAPVWSQARSPAHVQAEEESNVEINCEALGLPKPNISFLVNGVPVEDLLPSLRRSVNASKIAYRNVTTSDSKVIQCIASNEHGMILTNIIMSVTASPPSFIETPSNVKVVEGQDVLFRCRAYGAPKPNVTWRREKELVLGDRFIVHPSGTLEILNVSVSDSDTYGCHAVNKFGRDDVTVVLTVRSPTKIGQGVAEKTVAAGSHVTFPCRIEADPEEVPSLVVGWKKNNKTIDFSLNSRLHMNKDDFSLEVKWSRINDSGTYSCSVKSSLDAAESRAIQLTVRDRPDPPYDVSVLECAARHSVVLWRAGSDNNSPHIEFIVYYNISANGSSGFAEGARVKASKGSRFIQGQVVTVRVASLRPWSAYEFVVEARNHVGVSNRSSQSSEVCATLATLPDRNPGGVCSRLKGASQLAIVWQEIPSSEWNGEGFHYVVSYRQLYSSLPLQRRTIADPRQTELLVYDLGTFARYEIYVQSANRVGTVPINGSEKKIGYSGEGKPLDSPSNLQPVTATINSTYAEFMWDAVDTSPERVRGFFQGYRIRFWRSTDPDNIREEDIVMATKANLCPSLSNVRHRFVRSTSKVTGIVDRLWPFSKITLGVQVLSQTQTGPLSDTIEIETPEGAPGRVSSARITERGSSHLRVEWNFPPEPNGNVIGYKVSYHVAPPSVSRLQGFYINSSLLMSKKLSNLEFSTVYEIFVSAVTMAGIGEAFALFGETLASGAPDRPVILGIECGVNSANVSWLASDSLQPTNPGSHFHLLYRLKGVKDWVHLDLDPESDEYWVNVTELDAATYDFQVVSTNGFDDSKRENRSYIVSAYVGPEEDVAVTTENAETAPLLYKEAAFDWFIILICIVMVLLVVLIIFCIVWYSRGGMYPVSEKEKKCGHDPYAPEDVPFGEYSRSLRPDMNKSQMSLESDIKTIESESDSSLEEYDDATATKFTEDGSFIGLYVGKNNKNRRTYKDHTSPSALDTFV